MLQLINLKHSQQASPSRPKILRYPPWERTRTSVWAVKHTMSCRNKLIKLSDFFFFFYIKMVHYLLTQICITCCSSVMTVWTRKFPLSHGSVIPTEPGRKRPAASIWRQRLQYTCSFYPKIWKKRLMPITTSNWSTNRKFQLTCKQHWVVKAA